MTFFDSSQWAEAAGYRWGIERTLRLLALERM
jgi:O6-methylguanine-DNA--protein-cysteine methyltransferase